MGLGCLGDLRMMVLMAEKVGLIEARWWDYIGSAIYNPRYCLSVCLGSTLKKGENVGISRGKSWHPGPVVFKWSFRVCLLEFEVENDSLRADAVFFSLLC